MVGGVLGGRAEPSRVKGDVRVDTVGELAGFFTRGSNSVLKLSDSLLQDRLLF